MQSFRDAATLLLLVLLALTVRVQPTDRADAKADGSEADGPSVTEIASSSVIPRLADLFVLPADHDGRDVQVDVVNLDLDQARVLRQVVSHDDDGRLVLRVGKSTWVISPDVTDSAVGIGAILEAPQAASPKSPKPPMPCEARMARLTS